MHDILPGAPNPAAFTPRVVEPHTDAELREAFDHASAAFRAAPHETREIHEDFLNKILDDWLALRG